MDYGDIKRIISDFLKLSRWIKLLLIVVVVVVGILWVYSKYVQIPNLRSENAELKKTIKNKDDEITQLNLDKAELHREELHCEAILEPIRRKAEQLYPSLETDVALAKLIEDIESVRRLATRDIYRPLSQDLRDAIIPELQTIQRQNRDMQVTISVPMPAGNVCNEVAEELRDILVDANFKVDLERPAMIFTNDPAPVRVSLNKDDLKVVDSLWKVLNQFIRTKLSASEGKGFQRGKVVFKIAGEPIFSSDGVVTFK